MYVISYYDNYGQGTIYCDTYDEMQDNWRALSLDDNVSGISCSYEDDETGEVF